MQVILHLNYKNLAYESYVQDIPYYLLPVNGKPILLHTLLCLTEKINVQQFLFILHRDVCNVEQVESTLVDIMKEVNIPFRITISREMNSPLYIEEHLLEDIPLMFMEPTIQYKYMNDYISVSSTYDSSQLYVNEEEVAIIYFRSKKEYLRIGSDTLDILQYTDNDDSSLIWLNTPQKYIEYINQQKVATSTVIDDVYTCKITDTCTGMFKILDTGMGFRLDHFSIAIILEGSCCAVGDDIRCETDTILAGEGIFIANEYSKIFFLEDRSITDKKSYCALIDLKQTFPTGVVVSNTPPSMLQTDTYEIHCVEKDADEMKNIQHSTTRDIYILYDGQFYINDRTFLKDVVIDIPINLTFVKCCVSPCKYILIRIKENSIKDTNGTTEGIRQLSV